jgi:hypothetical protein
VVEGGVETARSRLKAMDCFMEVFSSMEHIEVDEQHYQEYRVFQKIKKVLRNYCVEEGCYPLAEILAPYDQEFARLRKELVEELLIKEEVKFR